MIIQSFELPGSLGIFVLHAFFYAHKGFRIVVVMAAYQTQEVLEKPRFSQNRTIQLCMWSFWGGKPAQSFSSIWCDIQRSLMEPTNPNFTNIAYFSPLCIKAVWTKSSYPQTLWLKQDRKISLCDILEYLRLLAFTSLLKGCLEWRFPLLPLPIFHQGICLCNMFLSTIYWYCFHIWNIHSPKAGW